MAKSDVVEKATNGAGAEDMARSALEHKELFVPAAVGLAGAIAAVKGPSVVRGLSNAVGHKAESTAKNIGAKGVDAAKQGAGEKLASGGLGARAVGKLTGLTKGAGGGGSGGKKTRRLPIQRWTDVAVPVDKAYEAWNQFDKYPKFMHRVLNVEQKGKDKINWQEKIWFSKRQWEGRITERRENDRIVWKTTSGMSHKGIVSFHKIDDNLTRVMVEMEFEPSGIIEKMASGLRFVKRAVQADLARFKAYVEMDDAKGIEYRSADEDEKENENDENDAQDGEEQDSDEGTTRESASQKRSRSRSSGGPKRSSTKRSSSTRTRASSGSRSSGSRKS